MRIIRRPTSLLVLAASGWLLAGCSSQDTAALAQARDAAKAQNAAAVQDSIQKAGLTLLWQFSFTEDFAIKKIGVRGNLLYATTTDARIYALDVSKGVILWQHALLGAVAGTPTVDAERGLVYIIHANKLWIVDKNSGQVKVRTWTVFHPTTSPLFTEHGVAIGAGDLNVHMMNPETGVRLWHCPIGSPVLYDMKYTGFWIAACGTARVALLTANDGSLRWTWKPEFGTTVRGPAVDEESVYVGATDGCVYCLDQMEGEVVWRCPVRGTLLQSPVVKGDRLLAGVDKIGAVAVDKKTGQLQWEVSGVKKLIALGDKTVYFHGQDKSIVGVDVETGRIVMRMATPHFKSFVSNMTGPIIYGLTEYNRLYAFREKAGVIAE